MQVRTAAMLVTMLVAPLGAQRPERQQELRLPGLAVVLRTGWQLILDHGCRFAVPATWHSTTDGGLMLASDGSSLALASARFAGWSVHKARVRTAFGQVSVVHEDSDHRLWFEIDDKQRTEHYVDVASGVGACIGVLDLPATTNVTAEDVLRIVDAIAPAPERWSPSE